MNIDVTGLMAARPPKHYNNCQVSDLDPLSKATIPREIEVILPDEDGSKVLAMWYGFPSLAVNDYVRLRRDTTDTNILIVEGAGGDTSGVPKISELWESDGGAVAWQTDAAGELTGNGTRDIFPQASTNGLNTRFEDLFGSDKPANLTSFQANQFLIDDEPNDQLGFVTNTTVKTDSYNPTSPFSKSNTGTVWFYVENHILKINSLSGTAKLIWSDGTSTLTQFYVWMQFAPRRGTTYGAEIRVFDVASPGAGDEYWALRFVIDTATYPDWPWRLRTFRGTGTTYAIADGTLLGDVPFQPTTMIRYGFRAWDSGGTPRFDADLMDTHGIDGVEIAGFTQANYPNVVKRIEIYTATSFQEMFMDSFNSAGF